MTKEQVRASFRRVELNRHRKGLVVELDKDVTRRNGWEFLKVGDKLAACEKCQGLGKGGKIVKICTITVLAVSREPLQRMLDEPEYGREECRREGFPDMTPPEFVEFFCKGHKGVTPDTILTRIEFGYAV